ncbi:MAG: nucleoside phosphorylase [Desulfobacter sp.]|nr:MAG: nucleoside phosphorylase [Desulfobacter sp.]
MSYPTWSDLNSPSIVPPLGARQAPDLGAAALMVSTAPDLRYIRANAGKLEETPFFNGSLFKDKENGVAVAGPYIGAPYGVMLLESLAAKGAGDIIILGWCGALTPDLSPGDLLVPDRALVDEGTSRHYMNLETDLPCTGPDPSLSRELVRLLAAAGDIPGEALHTGPVWTTDAIYRETPEKVAWYADKGALAVEMECSALFAAAAYRGVRTAALLVVSDSLALENGDWDPGFRKKRFKAMRKTACRRAVEITRKFAQNDQS